MPIDHDVVLMRFPFPHCVLPPRSHRRWCTIAALGAALLTVACIDKGPPTAVTRGPQATGAASLNLVVQARVSRAATRLKVVAGYARSSAPTVVIAIDSAVLDLTANDAQPVRVNATACLADAARERPQSETGDFSTGCLVHLAMTLLDDANRILDVGVAEPVAAKLGETATVPTMTLGGRVPSQAIASDGTGNCVLSDVGEAYCWGANPNGRLGTVNRDTIVSTPSPVVGGLRFRQIVMTATSSCGLTATAVTYCWGQNTNGELGNGSSTASTVPVPISGGHRFESISAGYNYVCGLTATGDAYCWGWNNRGQLGVGDTLNRSAPMLVSGGMQLAQVSAGFQHACGRLRSGTPAVVCWGSNQIGQFGVPSTTMARSLTPIAITMPAGLSFTTIEALEAYTCGLTSDGTMYCWGGDRRGETGGGTIGRGTVGPGPVAATGVSFSGITGGKFNLTLSGTCAWTTTGDAYCWGSNSSGQLGAATPPTTCGNNNILLGGCTAVPLRVATSERIVAMSQGGEHTCALTASHMTLCWGSNRAGQIGIGTTGDTTRVATRVLNAPRTP